MTRTVRTYQELAGFARAFAEQHFELFVVVGNPGLGKSRIVKQQAGSGAVVVESRATAFELYRELFRNLDEPFILDDVDELCRDPSAIRLLKCLCQSEPVKNVAWHSATPLLVNEGIPTRFRTRSKIAVIANEWRTLNKNVGAVEDRGMVVQFKPTAQEVHAWIDSWRSGQVCDEIFRFVGRYLHLVANPSARHYLVAQRALNAGLDWVAALFETWELDEPEIVVAKLARDSTLSQKQRVVAFRKATGKSRATFFRLWRKLGLGKP